jgi:L-asparagine oxygenase
MRRENSPSVQSWSPGIQSQDRWRNILAIHGWCDVEVQDESEFVRLADSLGKRIPSWRGGTNIDHLTIRGANEAPMNSFSYMFGDGAFPFHTDMARRARPPRYVLMRLASSSELVRPTSLLDFDDLNLSPVEQAALESEVWVVKGRPPFASSIFTKLPNSSQMLRYDPVCMRPAGSRAKIAAERFESVLAASTPVSYRWQPHHALVLDNWRVLHARPAEPEPADETRVLERVQVVVED